MIGLNNGFQITAPADTTPRILRVYVGVSQAGGRFEASLSDGSAPNYLDISLVNATSTTNAFYTLAYNAASAGQTVTIKWTANQSFNQFGNVTLQAATLVASPPIPATALREDVSLMDWLAALTPRQRLLPVG